MNALIGHVGADRVVFGTDNPFFPPPESISGSFTGDICTVPWPSTLKVFKTIENLDEVIIIVKFAMIFVIKNFIYI